MDEVKRTTILETMAEAMAERVAGGAPVTVADVIARSGISSATFHETFPDRDACLLAAFDLGLVRAHRRMFAAYDAEDRWLDAIKAALAAFLRFLEDEPELGRLLVVYSTNAGEQVLRRRANVLRALAVVVDQGRREGLAGKQQPPGVTAEGVVGAVLAVIQNRLLADPQGAVIDLFGSLVSIIVLPYLGVGVARRELTRPAPSIRTLARLGSTGEAGSAENGARARSAENGSGVSSSENGSRARYPENGGGVSAAENGSGVRSAESGGGARSAESGGGVRSAESGGGVRLTYRTARVLSAIADHPGASNREVADHAGIADQGQISKLLGRLEARQLITKMGEGRTRGAPNSWCVTERGELVLKMVSVAESL